MPKNLTTIEFLVLRLQLFFLLNLVGVISNK